MKNLIKKILLVSLALAIIVSMTACSSKNLVEPNVFVKNENPSKSSDETVYAENVNFKLIWSGKDKRIILFDKIRECSWSTVPEELLNGGEDGDTNHPKIETPLIIEYIETQNFSLKTANAYTACLNSSSNRGNYSIENIENGFKITYYFEAIEISIPIEYRLNDDGVSINVVSTEIAESGLNMLYRIIISPFMCSVPNVDEDAYLFYPSGSGVIINADNADEISTIVSDQVYGMDTSYFPSHKVMSTNTEKIKMPVFGSKNGNKAMLGIITKGADTAIIETDIGNGNIGYSAVYTSFNIRGKQTVSKAQNSTQYTDYYTSSPMEITFYPLYDDQANYVGMANRYRAYLIANNGLTEKEERASLSVSLVGGVSVESSFLGYPTNKVVPLTTISNAQQILSDLKATLNLPIVAEMFGYGSTGISIGKPAGGLKIAKSLGDSGDMKKLSEYAKDQDISLYMNYDLIFFNTDGCGLTTTNGGSAKGPANTYAKQQMFKLGTGNAWGPYAYYQVARDELAGLTTKAVNNCKKLTVAGIASRNLTSVSYSDCAQNQYIVKGNMAVDVTGMLVDAKSAGLNVLGYDANDYAATRSDAIISVPIYSNQHEIFDIDIPFYQMVFKGYVPMYGSSVNLTTTEGKTLLRCIEGGAAFNYTITDTYDIDTITAVYQMFSNTVYTDIKDSIVNSVNANKEYYEAIAGAKIVNHVCINNEVRKISYDNGVTVFVNYGESDYESSLGTVAAESYIFGKEAA